MWQAYLTVIAQEIAQAVHVLDRFQIMKKMGDAIDKVRRAEAKRLEEDGYEPVPTRFTRQPVSPKHSGAHLRRLAMQASIGHLVPISLVGPKH